MPVHHGSPQFLVISASNIKAVAANDVALQHYGQKVVYGYVATHTGRGDLIQIIFDVMSVRKPLLTTSALKNVKESQSFSITISIASFSIREVDEEVHAGDGDEVREARKASDGDRRADAHADQAGQLGISGKTKTPQAF